MKAVAYQHSLAVDKPNSLIDIELDKPVPTSRDLLVNVEAISVNPVDYKIRQNVDPQGDNKILGWDAVGTVVEVGEEVSLFKIGDKVYYAGDINRSGTNAEYQLVDERIVGHKPATLNNAEAAALPLTTITAWELLFERLNIKQHQDKSATSRPVLLVVGASGGVGSILIQLAKQLTNAIVIGTASRPETQAWVQSLGADYVIDHNKDLKTQIEVLNIAEVSHVACLTHSHQHLPALAELLKPQGKLAIIEFAGASFDIGLLKTKSISLHWEFMFTRAMYTTDDMREQHTLLDKVAVLIDEGKLRTTVGKHMGKINAENLRAAHKISESNQAIGKIVLEGF